jgi:D-alanyl-D-alanine dipeptidase
MPDGNTAVLEDSLSPTSAKAIVHRRTQLQQAYMARWNATATSLSSGAILDGIITPASAWAACKRGTVEKTEYFGFGGVFNALGMLQPL